MSTTHKGKKSSPNGRRIQTRTYKAVVGTTVLAAAIGFAALGPASPSSAQVLDYQIAVNCDPPPDQLCTPVAARSFFTVGPYYYRFQVDPGHCSDVRVQILLDGHHVRTSVFGPGGRFQTEGMTFPGFHTVTLQAEGVPGGCNTGSLNSWSGNLHIETNLDGYEYLNRPF